MKKNKKKFIGQKGRGKKEASIFTNNRDNSN